MNQSEFRNKIYELTRQIPRGKVATYGQLADLTGHLRSARAVGSFMKTNPDAPRTPCHRVVAADGSLTGYAMGEGIVTKKSMLLAEGVVFKPNGKVDIAKSLWEPEIINRT